jgi:hypothetical protein
MSPLTLVAVILPILIVGIFLYFVHLIDGVERERR